MNHPAAGSGRYRLGLLCLTALGIVFGDIGTSPLYALRECFEGDAARVNRESVLGVMSLIVWTISLMISVQYVGLVMRADQQGEGGILSLLGVAFPERPGRDAQRLPKVMLG